METISNFTNPFQLDENESLVCLSSGMSLPQEVAERMVKIDDIGSKQYKEFIEERLNEKKNRLPCANSEDQSENVHSSQED